MHVGDAESFPLVQVSVVDPDNVNPDLQVTSYVDAEFIVPESGLNVPSFIVGLLQGAETH